MTTLNENSGLVEVAAVVSEALEDAGIIAPLSGGAAMSMYTDVNAGVKLTPLVGVKLTHV